MNLKAIKDRLVSLLKDKSSGIQPEFQKQLSEIIKRIEELLRDNHGECDIPDELIKEIAKCLIPDIIKFLESDKGKEEFEKWKNSKITDGDYNVNSLCSANRVFSHVNCGTVIDKLKFLC